MWNTIAGCLIFLCLYILLWYEERLLKNKKESVKDECNKSSIKKIFKNEDKR